MSIWLASCQIDMMRTSIPVSHLCNSLIFSDGYCFIFKNQSNPAPNTRSQPLNMLLSRNLVLIHVKTTGIGSERHDRGEVF